MQMQICLSYTDVPKNMWLFTYHHIFHLLCIIIVHSMYNFINWIEFSHFCFKIYPSWVVLGFSLHLVNTDS